MLDLSHEWGGDLAISSSGDIALATGSAVTNQRVYRRLLTNPGDYLWHLNYGGGLAQFVGLPASPPDIEAIIRDQLEQETAIAQSPIPEISAKIEDPTNGYVVADIGYWDISASTMVQLSVNSGS
jgi:hypothetical protein